MPLLWWFAETSVVAACLALVAWSLGRWRRLDLGPGARHLLWVVVLIKLLTPPLVSWQSVVGTVAVQQPVDRPSPARLDESAPVVSPLMPASLPEVDRVADTFDRDWDALDVHTSPQPLPLSAPIAAAKPVPAPIAPSPPALPRADASNPQRTIQAQKLVQTIGWVLLVIWAVGAVWVSLQQMLRLWFFSRRLASAMPAPDWLIEEVDRLAMAMGVRVPRVLCVQGTLVPMVWCLGRPALLVPEPETLELSSEGWRGVLTHELAHLKRGDQWVARLDLVAAVIWWWSPLYRLTWSRINELAELACDAWVVRVGPKACDRHQYAEALVDVCEQISTARSSVVLGMGVSGGARSLEGRLNMILQEKNPRPSPGRWALVAAIMVLITLPGWTQSPPPGPADKPVPAAPAAKSRSPLTTAPRSSEVPAAPASKSGDPFATAPRSSEVPASSAPAWKSRVPSSTAPAPASADLAPSAGVARDAHSLPEFTSGDLAPASVRPSSNPFDAKAPEKAGEQPSTLSPDLKAPETRLAADRSSTTLSASDRQMNSQFQMATAVRASQFKDVTARLTSWVEQRYLNGEEETRLVVTSMEWLTGSANGDFKRDRLWTYLPLSNERTSSAWKPVHSLFYKQGTDLISHQEFVETGAWLSLETTPRELSMEASGLAGMDLPLGHPSYFFPGLWAGSSLHARGGLTKDIVMVTVDGLQTMKQTWTFTTSDGQPPLKMTVWSAPKYGHAPVRVEYQKLSTSGRSLLTTRIRYRDFVTKEGLSYATRVEAIRDEFQDDGTLQSRVRMRSVVDEVKINGGVSANTFKPRPHNASDDFDEEGDGPGRTPLAKLSSPSMRYKFEKLTDQQIQAFRKALESGPFGMPVLQKSGGVVWRFESNGGASGVTDASVLPPPTNQPSLNSSVPAPAVDPSVLPPSSMKPSLVPNAPAIVTEPGAVVTAAPTALAPPVSSDVLPPPRPTGRFAEPELAPAAPPTDPSSAPVLRQNPGARLPAAVTPASGIASDEMADDLAIPVPAARVSLAELKDEIELMKVRLEGKRAEFDVATARCKAKAALVDNLKLLLDRERNAVSRTDMFKAEFDFQESRAALEQARVAMTEAELRITLANRRFDRELRRDKRELEAAIAEYKQWEASHKEPMSRRASERIRRLREQLEEVEEAPATPPASQPDQPKSKLEAESVRLQEALDALTKRRDQLKRTKPEDPALKVLNEEEQQLRTQLQEIQKTVNPNANM